MTKVDIQPPVIEQPPVVTAGMDFKNLPPERPLPPETPPGTDNANQKKDNGGASEGGGHTPSTP